MRPPIVVLLLSACGPPGSQGTEDTFAGPGGTSYPGTPTVHIPGGVQLVSGLDATELAVVLGQADRLCGWHAPVPLSDLDGDGTADLGLLCRGDDEYVLHFLGGTEALAGTWASHGSMTVATHGFHALGDVDGDGLNDVGFNKSWQTLNSQGELDWWYVRPGSSLSGDTSGTAGAIQVAGDGGEYGGDGPYPVGDVDSDGLADMVVWQHPGSDDPMVHLLSGADVALGISVLATSVASFALPSRDTSVTSAAGVGDLDGDGIGDIAIGELGGSDTGGGGAGQAVVRVLGSSGSLELRITGTTSGSFHWAAVEALPDLDGDGLPELAALMVEFSSSQDNGAEVIVVPGADLAAGVDLAAAPYALGGTPDRPVAFEACDLDGDGLPELILDGLQGTWSGADLLTPGAVAVGPGVEGPMSCLGDLDGVPGSELAVGRDELTAR